MKEDVVYLALPYNLDVTLDLARKELEQGNPREIAVNKGATWDGEKKVLILPSLSDVFHISCPGGTISTSDGSSVDPRVQVLILHYLMGPAVARRGEWVSFKELPGGLIYQQPFYGRAVLPLVRTFGQDPAGLLQAARPLGGRPVNLGDAAVELNPFPTLPVRLVIWAGDDEIPPSGTILFDASAAAILATEDHAVLAEYLVKRLQGQARESK
ncbi:hypothetical protein MGLY_29420 [Neomoorella glycerini]|uniref:DUF3786 domain-containing protein n=1 Tax=Neomoorella glycerini TaxID=55779 RepID=A0A6I5ZV54_9FIRM|nr:DUF3786 domain-containing protein [Moorella glycerini]QGP93529.1 hypothetical protein MGLY_29420 [Moorella glycerini]